MYYRKELKPAVMQVYYWRYSNTGSFNNMLLDLMNKADFINFAKLSSAYPELALAFNMWKEAGDEGKDLFRLYEIFI